ncbi:hypothetical protein BJ684DRAFT_15190 [Piptocephalis cylindrospora]|uniref:Uncharacterized protein n=1 Tax=Piptocephalis cylindrospora TaxID=1907219 RepID=A0A4P9Y651_9FUNG|nr:hypothetical protein BJ684DRAFT_15190 [Piptocephalis cylindrospora]|eukprot:RKP14497.1 hypothetical protein BJ684DRAFT_15190 [Piptocephalis cylindrospora]
MTEDSGASPNEILLGGARQGNPELIQEALAEGADIGHRDGLGATALHYAAGTLSFDALKALLESPGLTQDLINVRENVTGEAAIHRAAAAWDRDPEVALETLALLVDKGADVTLTDRQGSRPIARLPPQGAQEARTLFQQAALAKTLGAGQEDSDSEGEASSEED